MNLTRDQIRDIIAAFRVPDRRQYPELDGYTRDELYRDCSGGGGLYLATLIQQLDELEARYQAWVEPINRALVRQRMDYAPSNGSSGSRRTHAQAGGEHAFA